MTNSSLNQWVELLDLSDTCLIRPETCGAEGASLTAWIKVFEIDYNNVIISSKFSFYGILQEESSAGIWIIRYQNHIK